MEEINVEENSVEIIQRILDGEEEAFSLLFQKYQNQVHTLAWQKLGDYHIAEEITQDTFVKAFEKLHDLKNPKQFDGWLYVIVNRLCINWLQRNKNTFQSIEDTPIKEIEEVFYKQHESDQREMETTELYRDIVKKLLKKLPESERTVLNLYYIGEMDPAEISKFLGVSVNTIKSRLHRAKNRLKTAEETLNTEYIRSVQLSRDLTDSVMRRIADIDPTPPKAKPLIPWTALGTAVLVVMLLLGSMNQYFTHFQKPFDYAALSEPTIELVESPIHIDIVSTPTLQRRIGGGVTNSQNEGVDTTFSNEDFASNHEDNAFNSSIDPWSHVNGPQASPQARIFSTSDNIYAISRTSIYKLSEDETSWMNINANVPSNMYRSPLTEHEGVLYSVDTNEIFASTDDGETWNRFCSRPDGVAVGLIIKGDTQEELLMYLALKDKRFFQSANAGKEWILLNNDLTGERITAVASVGNTLFIGTNRSLHRLKSGLWNEIPLDPLKTVHSMAVLEKDLYVVTGPDFLSSEYNQLNSPSEMSRKIFHSADTGATWHDITPEDESFVTPPILLGPTNISVVEKSLFVLSFPAFQSRDGGKTWKNRGLKMNLFPSDYPSISATNEFTFYKLGPQGFHSTTDSGDTWQPFSNSIVKTKVLDMVAFKNRLYVYTSNGFFKSDDTGNSWEDIQIDYCGFIPKTIENNPQMANYFTNSKLICTNNTLYAIISQQKELRIFRLRDDDVLSLIHRIPSSELWVNAKDLDDKDLLVLERQPIVSRFAVSGNTFYAEYRRKLLKWTLGSIDTVDTGLTDLNIRTDNLYDRGTKLAASATTVYMGKRDGKLFESTDSGNSWQDITPNIPYKFTNIKDMVFVGSTVFIATDKGVITSQTGEHWQMLTDKAGENINIDRLAMVDSDFYGAGNMGAYRLNSHGRWEQISANIPDRVITLSASSDKLYIGTEKRGIFHISLQDNPPETRTATIRSVR